MTNNKHLHFNKITLTLWGIVFILLIIFTWILMPQNQVLAGFTATPTFTTTATPTITPTPTNTPIFTNTPPPPTKTTSTPILQINSQPDTPLSLFFTSTPQPPLTVPETGNEIIIQQTPWLSILAIALILFLITKPIFATIKHK